MRILLKCPTRSRPHKVLATLRKYVQLAQNRDQIGIAVSCDEDDTSMNQQSVRNELETILNNVAWHKVFYSRNTSKIEACNANMNEITYPWDIVVLVSDDMIPQVTCWDGVIRNHMAAYFPNTDGILWFNDGCQGEKLNTLCVYGRKMFDETLKYMYEPEYKSFYCDTELTDRCNAGGDLASRCHYVPYCIIRHEHPGTGYAQNMDQLYATNQRFWSQDLRTYIRRKKYAYDWSILIPTIPGREDGLRRLIDSIHEKIARIYPELRYEIRVEFDNREASVGKKRQKLLQAAKGKYLSFIDDDDEITDEYIEDLRATVQGNYHVMRLRGNIHPYTFTHSIDNRLDMPMARGEVFLRPPNHLTPMLSDVAKLFHFKDATRGEDLEWTIRLAQSGFLLNEYKSDENRIHYNYNLGSRKITPEVLNLQKTTNYSTMLQMVWTSNGAEAPVSQEQSSAGPRVIRWSPRGFVSK